MQSEDRRGVALSMWEGNVFRDHGVHALAGDTERSEYVVVVVPTAGASCRGHSVASEHVGLRSLCLQEAIVDNIFIFEVNPAYVCTKALLGGRIQELRRFACVFLCHSEDVTGTDPELQSLSWLDEGSAGGAKE